MLPFNAIIPKLYKILGYKLGLCGHNNVPSLGNRVFLHKTELWLMDLCLPEESGVVFLHSIIGRDGEPVSIYQLISGH